MSDHDRSADDQVRLAAATRRLLQAVRRTEVDAATIDEAIAGIDAAADTLGSKASAGPWWQAGFTSFDGWRMDADPLSVFPYSPAMGPKNPIGPEVELRVEDEVVHGTATFSEIHNGPPFDTAHGGMIALVYDDLVGLAAMIGAGGGMTARLAIDYRRRTPMFEPVELKAWTVSAEGRKIIARGEMRFEGELLSEAEGLFIQPRAFGGAAPSPDA